MSLKFLLDFSLIKKTIWNSVYLYVHIFVFFYRYSSWCQAKLLEFFVCLLLCVCVLLSNSMVSGKWRSCIMVWFIVKTLVFLPLTTLKNLLVQLDDGFGRIIDSECENGTVLCEGLQDGNHKFEVCPNGSQGVGCGSYNWTVG